MRSLLERFARADKGIPEVGPEALASWLEGGEAVLVDVREPMENAMERIAGDILVPLSSFDPARLPAAVGRKLVLYCRSGNRSGLVAKKLTAAGRGEVWNLRGGILAWKRAGLPTERGR